VRANRKTVPRRRGFPRSLLPVLLALAVSGCLRQQRPLTVADLTPAERELATRFIVLERARAIALADTAAGNAILDSLALVWGDTALAAARRALPADNDRLAAFYELLGRLLETERDSLLAGPSPRRLGAPLPRPAPPSG